MSEFERWQGRYSVPDYIFGEGPNYFHRSPARRCCPHPGRRSPLQMVKAAMASGWPNRGSMSSRSTFRQRARTRPSRLARAHGVSIRLIEADVHNWDYPEDAFDVVAEIFTQFSSPSERKLKWDGMKKTLKPGGLLILQGYTPKQLEYKTGGPGKLENLYTKAMLEEAFGHFTDKIYTEEELEMHEGSGHGGMSAVIGLTARKPA